MNKKLLEIISNLLFWGVSSWLITSVFSIVRMETTIINDIETSFVERDPDLILFFVVGQLLYAVYFYGLLYAIRNISGKTDIRLFLVKAAAASITFLWLFYLISNQFILIDRAPFPGISFALFGFYAAVATGYGFVKIWIRNERDRRQLELVKNQAELKLLRAQLHPHFLFNTMNNLLSMVDQQANPLLAKSIDKLSGLLRYVVYETNSGQVPIKAEIKFLENFAALHLLRFEEGELDFKLKIQGDFDQQLIEPGILLCFVENAFKHGAQPEMLSFIHINVDLSEKDQIQFDIINSIPPTILEAHKGGYGLQATKEQLQLAYPDKHQLNIASTATTYRVTLKIDSSSHDRNNR